MNPNLFCYVCKICRCSFSGHCDQRELLDHVLEEHPEQHETQNEGYETYFEKQIASYLMKKYEGFWFEKVSKDNG